MISKLPFALVLGLVIGLSGCASRYSEPGSGNLAEAENWAFVGKLGVRAADENANLAVEWEQQGARFEIALAGPLGLSVARIYGDEHGVTLETREGEALKAGDPNELLLMTLGYDIPVEPMRYWVRGIPAPWAPHKRTRDGLRQLGWTITWEQWENARPTKMRFQVPEASLKLVVRHWRVSP